jgi:hypothetical protein
MDQSQERTFAEILCLPTNAQVELMRRVICNLDPNGGVMTLVAYKNIRPILETMREVADRSVPKSLNEFILFLCRDIDSLPASAQNEIPRRRMLWFLHGLMVIKADEIAQSSPEVLKHVVEIWVHLIACSRVLRTALVNNALWSDEEKLWFGTQKKPFCFVPTEAKAMEWCTNQAMPRWLRDNELLVERLAKWCISEIGRSQALAYYHERAADFRQPLSGVNEVHVAVRDRLAIKYQEIADDIASEDSQFRHPLIVWSNWLADLADAEEATRQQEGVRRDI